MNESPVRFPHPRPFSQGEKGDYGVTCRDFHANFHDAHRHTPNDEKSAGFCRGGFQTRPTAEIDLIRPENALGGFETRPYETVLCRYVDDVFHANFHGAGHPER